MANKINQIFFQGSQTGKDNGYTILLDIESFDYEFFKEGSEGLKVALVHHLVSTVGKCSFFSGKYQTNFNVPKKLWVLNITLGQVSILRINLNNCNVQISAITKTIRTYHT